MFLEGPEVVFYICMWAGSGFLNLQIYSRYTKNLGYSTAYNYWIYTRKESAWYHEVIVQLCSSIMANAAIFRSDKGLEDARANYDA